MNVSRDLLENKDTKEPLVPLEIRDNTADLGHRALLDPRAQKVHLDIMDSTVVTERTEPKVPRERRVVTEHLEWLD